ncbi:LPS export ABC transporter periplasmic protein LptC [Glycocaulis abyssi]|uniref:LPS export ABC transporter periplasmic protein LptC n=1 Tax=Glycocaulis abyssi TaxID=1433403 RepID=A0ABV9NB78_9PROT
MHSLTFAAAEPSASRAVAAARMRARVVRNVRIVLIVLIGALAANLVAQSVLTGNREPASRPAMTGDGERIINPRFTGRDAHGRPYVLTADSAVRRMVGLGNLTDLENPRIDYMLLIGGSRRPDASEVLSRLGVYDDATRTLRMTDTVRFSTRSGYEFRTEGASIDLDEGVVYGEEPVQGRAPWGGVQAYGFELYEDGRRLRFTGGVVTRFYVGDGAPAPEEEE